jgi:signal transduction histidine kinase
VRRRLIVVAAAISLMVTIAFLAPLVVLVRTVARDRALTDAERDAAALAPALAVTGDPTNLGIAISGTNAGRDNRLTVVLADGAQLGAPTPVDDNLTLAQRGTSFSVALPGGVAVFLPVNSPAAGGTSVVRVWVPDALLEKGVNRATAILVGLGGVLVLVAIGVSDRLGASMVRPVRRLADAAVQLGEGDLDQRVTPEGPREVAAVARAFNLLAGRVGELLVAERELVADLSHRLRTPLTVLRFEVDAVDDADARNRIRAAADDLEAAVTAVIQEARRPITTTVRVPSDIVAVTDGRVRFWSALAEDQARSVTVDLAPGPIPVDVVDQELEAAIDAILGNIFEHTEDGTAFAVTLRRVGAGTVEVLVDDAGAGIDDTRVARGASGGGSTGLGLDIARRTVEAAGGELRLGRSDLGGSSITLALPVVRR